MQIHPGSSPIISHAGQGLHQWFPRGAGNMQITGNWVYWVGMAGEVGGEQASELARRWGAETQKAGRTQKAGPSAED